MSKNDFLKYKNPSGESFTFNKKDIDSIKVVEFGFNAFIDVILNDKDCTKYTIAKFDNLKDANKEALKIHKELL